jgi:hypothetical protein
MLIDVFPNFQRQSPIQQRLAMRRATTMAAYDWLPLKGSLPHILVIVSHLFFLGTCFLSFVFPSASDIQVPEMGQPGWFDKSKERSGQQFAKGTVACLGASLVSNRHCFSSLHDWPITHSKCCIFSADLRWLGISPSWANSILRTSESRPCRTARPLPAARCLLWG